MAAPKGNQYAKGNKGGRQKSGDVKWLQDLWEGNIKFSQVKPKAKKVYVTVVEETDDKTTGKKKKASRRKTEDIEVFKSGRDAFAYKVLSGELRSIHKLADKLYADVKSVEVDNFNHDEVNTNDMSRYNDQELRRIIQTAGNEQRGRKKDSSSKNKKDTVRGS